MSHRIQYRYAACVGSFILSLKKLSLSFVTVWHKTSARNDEMQNLCVAANDFKRLQCHPSLFTLGLAELAGRVWPSILFICPWNRQSAIKAPLSQFLPLKNGVKSSLLLTLAIYAKCTAQGSFIHLNINLWRVLNEMGSDIHDACYISFGFCGLQGAQAVPTAFFATSHSPPCRSAQLIIS